MSSSTRKRKPKTFHDIEYKRRIVQEYLEGKTSALEIAEREGLERGQIYKWKVQFDNRARGERIEEIASEEGVSLEQARKIRELEEELSATQKKLAQLAIENECLSELVKKTDPSSAYARRSSGFAEIKAVLARSKGRAK